MDDFFASTALAVTEIHDSIVNNEDYTVDQSISKQEYEANMERNESTLADDAVNVLTQELDNLAVSRFAENTEEAVEKAKVRMEREEDMNEGREEGEIDEEEVK